MSYLEEIFNKYKQSNNWKGLLVKLRYDENLKNELIEKTSFLNKLNPSISERIYYYKEGFASIQICPYCHKNPLKFKKLDKGFFKTCGSKKCLHESCSKGARQERDWKEIQKKMKKTYKERTGYEHNMQNPNFIEKMNNDPNHKWGVQSDLAKENREKALIEKYGSLSNVLKENIEKTYGSFKEFARKQALNASKIKQEKDLEDLMQKIKDFDFTYLGCESPNGIYHLKCNKCGTKISLSRYSILYNYRLGKGICPKCDFKDMTFRSGFEKEVGSFISSLYNGEIQYNKHINGHECDIIIPEKKIAIECNGCYWHTEQYKKEKDSHQRKKIDVEKEGYNLIQIWDDNWNDLQKREIIYSRLKSKLGLSKKVFARKCKIKEVSGKETKSFLNENHLQGYVQSSFNLGLYLGDELLEIATFGKTRKVISGNKKAIELYRLCSKKDYNVIGGFSKLMKYALNHFKDKKIISYSDCDWCNLNSNGYEKVGFKWVGLTGPNYWWCIDGIRRNRLNYTKKKLIEEGKDPNLTEKQIMQNGGYYRIFGSGNLIFEIN